MAPRLLGPISWALRIMKARLRGLKTSSPLLEAVRDTLWASTSDCRVITVMSPTKRITFFKFLESLLTFKPSKSETNAIFIHRTGTALVPGPLTRKCNNMDCSCLISVSQISSYTTNWEAYASLITQIFNTNGISVKYQGAIFCCDTNWLKAIPLYIDNTTSQLWSISIHSYAQDNGNLANLLTKNIAPYNPSLYGLSTAKANGLQYWMGESGSVAGLYSVNVSDTFGGGLWAIDWTFTAAAYGYEAISYHGIGAMIPSIVYMPWSAGNPFTIYPLYYAMLAFSRTIGGSNAYIWPQGPHLNVTSTQPQVSVWSTVDSVTGLRKVIINHRNITSGVPNAQVIINFTSTTTTYFSNAVLFYFEAPSGTSKTGVKLAGQTFEGSLDGTIQGTRTTFNLTTSGNNTWVFTMQPARTAFITFCPTSNSEPCGGQTSSSSSDAKRITSWISSLLLLWEELGF